MIFNITQNPDYCTTESENTGLFLKQAQKNTLK